MAKNTNATDPLVKVRIHQAIAVDGTVHRPHVDGRTSTPTEAQIPLSIASAHGPDVVEILETPTPAPAKKTGGKAKAGGKADGKAGGKANAKGDGGAT